MAGGTLMACHGQDPRMGGNSVATGHADVYALHSRVVDRHVSGVRMDAPSAEGRTADLRFLLTEDEERYADGLPPISEPEHEPEPGFLMRALMPAANDSLSDLAIVGWAPGAAALLLADPDRKSD